MKTVRSYTWIWIGLVGSSLGLYPSLCGAVISASPGPSATAAVHPRPGASSATSSCPLPPGFSGGGLPGILGNLQKSKATIASPKAGEKIVGDCSFSQASPVSEMVCDPRPGKAAYDRWTSTNNTLKEEIIACKESIAGIPKLTQCFQQDYDQLTQLINGFKSQLQMYQDQSRKAVMDMSNAIEDRKDQIKYVEAKLHGPKGLENAQALIKDKLRALTSMPRSGGNSGQEQSQGGILEQVRQGKRNLQTMDANLVQFKKIRKLALARQCMMGSGVPFENESCFKCAWRPDQKASCMPLTQYISCRYGREWLKSGSGGSESYSYLQNEAEKTVLARQSDLDVQMKKIIDALPEDASMPVGDVNAQTLAMAGRADSGKGYKDIDQLEAEFGGGFDQFQDVGKNIRGFFFKQLKACTNGARSNSGRLFLGAAQQIAEEEKSKASSIGIAQEQIANQKILISKSVNEALRDYAEGYGQVMAAVVGKTVKPPLGNCIDAPLEYSERCLESMQRGYEILLDGHSEVSRERTLGPEVPAINASVDVPSRNPLTQIRGACNSVNQCVDQYQLLLTGGTIAGTKQRAPGLFEDQRRMEVQKENYVAQANGEMEKAARAYAVSAQQLSSLLEMRLTQMMGQVGVGAEYKRIAIENSKLEIDEKTGLYKMPGSILGLVAGFMDAAPPARTATEEIQGKISEKKKDMAKAETELKSSNAKIATMFDSDGDTNCGKKDGEKEVVGKVTPSPVSSVQLAASSGSCGSADPSPLTNIEIFNLIGEAIRASGRGLASYKPSPQMTAVVNCAGNKISSGSLSDSPGQSRINVTTAGLPAK